MGTLTFAILLSVQTFVARVGIKTRGHFGPERR
jgi:hypothetical protein